MKKILYCIAAGSIFCMPFAAHAQVIINEVAWMGTADSANDEWIELYNSGSEAVNLDGWKLAARDGTPHIDLSGTISGGGYFLLERTSDDTVPDISADGIYSGALSNSGESLVLTDNTGNTADEVDASQGWPAGNSDTKESMQWNGEKWITAQPTPKAANNLIDSGSLSEDSGASDDSDDTSSSQTDSDLSSHASPEPLSGEEHVTFYLEKGRDRLVSVGEPVEFKTQALYSNGTEISGAHYQWSTGDGGEESGKDVEHTYKFPGDYVVVANAQYSDTEAVARMNVKVVEPDIHISAVHNDSVELENDSAYELNLNGWMLSDGMHDFTFPRDTIILAGSKITFPQSITGLSGTSITLKDQQEDAVGNEDEAPDLGARNGTSTEFFEPADGTLSDASEKLSEAKEEVAVLRQTLAALQGLSHSQSDISESARDDRAAAGHASSMNSIAESASGTAPFLAASSSASSSNLAAGIEVYRGEAKNGVLHALIESLEHLFGG